MFRFEIFSFPLDSACLYIVSSDFVWTAPFGLLWANGLPSRARIPVRGAADTLDWLQTVLISQTLFSCFLSRRNRGKQSVT